MSKVDVIQKHGFSLVPNTCNHKPYQRLWRFTCFASYQRNKTRKEANQNPIFWAAQREINQGMKIVHTVNSPLFSFTAVPKNNVHRVIFFCPSIGHFPFLGTA